MTIVEKIVARGFDKEKVVKTIETAHLFAKGKYMIRLKNFDGSLKIEGDNITGLFVNDIKDKDTGITSKQYSTTVEEHLRMLVNRYFGLDEGRKKLLVNYGESSRAFEDWTKIRGRLLEYYDVVGATNEQGFDMDLVA